MPLFEEVETNISALRRQLVEERAKRHPSREKIYDLRRRLAKEFDRDTTPNDIPPPGMKR